MTAMTNVAVPVSNGTDAIWTAIYTAGGAITIAVHNRHPAVDLLVRVNGSSTAAGDAADAAAERLLPHATMSITLANGDKVFAKPLDDRGTAGRCTVRA